MKKEKKVKLKADGIVANELTIIDLSIWFSCLTLNRGFTRNAYTLIEACTAIGVETMLFMPCSSLMRYNNSTTQIWKKATILYWENSLHLATPSLVSPRIDIGETRAEIPYWWRITAQIWVVLLIGWNKLPTNQPISTTWTGWWQVISMEFLCSLIPQIPRETIGSVAKCRLLF